MKKSFFNKNNPWKLFFYNEENKSKEILGKNVLSFTKFVSWVFFPGRCLAWGGGFVRGLYVGVFCPVIVNFMGFLRSNLIL